MTVAMFFTWDGLKAEQYDAAVKAVAIEQDPPPGQLFHAAAVDEDGLHVLDLWESEDAWQAFLESRLLPAIGPLGLQGQPRIRVAEVRNLFTPGFKPV